MKIGFSGTRNGMTGPQEVTFHRIMRELRPTHFHHGACRGADAEAARFAVSDRERRPPPHVTAHPGQSAHGGENEWLDRDSLDAAHEVRPTKTHFARNRDIVDETDALIACPPCKPLPESGGTAMTVNYARKRGKPVYIIWPDGEVTRDPPAPPSIPT